MSADEQGVEQWKQKYYDQLDRLETKEKDWELLESTLKRTIGRLSLAAEGQHKTLDRHIGDLRSSIKNDINRQRVESIVDDISKVLTQLEEKQSHSDRTSVNTLELLVADLSLPESFEKPRKKLLKQLEKSEDDQREKLLAETIKLLKSAFVSQKDSSPETNKPGLLNRLLHSEENSDNKTQETIVKEAPLNSQPEINISLLNSILEHIFNNIPWPELIRNESQQSISLIKNSLTQSDLQLNLKNLQSIISRWPAPDSSTDTSVESSTDTINPQFSNTQPPNPISIYKTCLIELFDKIDNNDSPGGKLAALRLSATNANNKDELDTLSAQLASMLVDHSDTNSNAQFDLSSDSASNPSAPKNSTEKSSLDHSFSETALQPSIQELLIRLLEQLIVPIDLQKQADSMKQRLEQDTDPANWKRLLKDVATLINSIRSFMQNEKHEFENFLQQVTDRLKSMDLFLQTETESLQAAEVDGTNFGKSINLNVDEIRTDLNQATDLNDLKSHVSSKLDTISKHIKLYRETESQRILESQSQVKSMHERMQALENESETLKKVVIEKNKQAMFDTLTGIPNRLSYDKKIEEEVSRWQRFNNPLSLAIWDIDFFKKVNDTYGHKAGDKVLRTVAQLLFKRIRTTDFLARYGGEEFVMLLPGTKQEETLRLVNDLRQQVESCGFHNHGESVTITVSCGISSFNEGDNISQVFDRADKALYKAKDNGRNQCVVASCLSD